METTLIIVKPDGMHRGLCGRIICRFEDKGLQLVGAKLMQIDEDLAGRHYAEHKDKSFYGELVEFITSTPVMVMAIRGVNAIAVCRSILGPTKGYEAPPGTVRGDFSSSGSYNLVHGSDSPESAQRELALFFSADELHDYTRAIDEWVSAPFERG